MPAGADPGLSAQASQYIGFVGGSPSNVDARDADFAVSGTAAVALSSPPGYTIPTSASAQYGTLRSSSLMNFGYTNASDSVTEVTSLAGFSDTITIDGDNDGDTAQGRLQLFVDGTIAQPDDAYTGESFAYATARASISLGGEGSPSTAKFFGIDAGEPLTKSINDSVFLDFEFTVGQPFDVFVALDTTVRSLYWSTGEASALFSNTASFGAVLVSGVDNPSASSSSGSAYGVSAVPEPASLGALLSGSALLVRRRRSRD